MRDFPVFTTEYGVASLILKEVPYRQEAYIILQATEAPEEPTEATEATTPSAAPPAEIPTQSPSTAPTQTQSDPLPQPQEPEEPGSRSWIALIIIAVVAAFLLIGTGITMLTGSRRSRGRYSR